MIVMEDLKVSVICLTYNQKDYIRSCLDGILSQRTSFAYQVIVHDDASTDGTSEIIDQYAKSNDNIIVLRQKENQYSQGLGLVGLQISLSKALGTYIAFCEGDDYWTDVYKLQKQVAFMDAHPEYSLCSHRFSILNQNDGTFSEDWLSDFCSSSAAGTEYGNWDNFNVWISQPLSIVFRKCLIDQSIFRVYGPQFRDIHLVYHLLRKGKGYCLSDNMGVYRICSSGVDSTVKGKQRDRLSISLYGSLLAQNRDDIQLEQYYQRVVGGYYIQYIQKPLVEKCMGFDVVKDLLFFFKINIQCDGFRGVYRCIRKVTSDYFCGKTSIHNDDE